MEMLLRSAIALGIVFVGVAAYLVWTRLLLVRRRGKMKRGTPLGLETRRVGVPAILYFTTPDCVPCRTQQIPALESLVAQYGERIQIIRIDALEHPRIADYWGVLSVPTTFVVDADGQPRRVNHGVASAAKLRQQFREIGALPDSSAQEIENEVTGARRKPCEEC
jgi:thioredoxin 1